MLAVKDRKSRAEIGYGVEPIITDGAAGGILRQIRPILQQGNYGGALLAAAEQMGNTIAQSKGVALDSSRAAAWNRRRVARALDSVSADLARSVLPTVVVESRRAGRQRHGFPDGNDSR